MAGADKLYSINARLDELFVKQLELMQNYVSVTTECESHQKTGFINLAKARYIQGFHTVSKNCLFSEDTEEEREALLTVSREKKTMELERQSADDSKSDLIKFTEPQLNVSTKEEVESLLNKQFGFLSSATLKTAKKEFQRCLEKSMERVAIMNQILAIQEHYEDLMREKMDIEKGSSRETAVP